MSTAAAVPAGTGLLAGDGGAQPRGTTAEGADEEELEETSDEEPATVGRTTADVLGLRAVDDGLQTTAVDVDSRDGDRGRGARTWTPR